MSLTLPFNVLYNEIKEYQKEMIDLRKELHEWKGALIPTELISDENHKEVDIYCLRKCVTEKVRLGKKRFGSEFPCF